MGRGERELCGVRNLYERPEQLGPDRWASLIAARTLEPGRACLVVNAGTCTTVDMLSVNGEFAGGLILPGIDLMRFVLHEHTGRLPLQEGRYVRAPRTPSTRRERLQPREGRRLSAWWGHGGDAPDHLGRRGSAMIESLECLPLGKIGARGPGKDRSHVRTR